MTKTISKRPKTHSDILWHFTGGPRWNKKQNNQSRKLKSTKNAFEALTKILESKTLKVGDYHEVIKCTVQDKTYNKETNKIDTQNNVIRTVSTSPVCCVADIPLTELFHHAKRYGKFAIGFKRNSLVKANFNPVFYTLHDTEIISNFYNAQNALIQSECGIEDAISNIEDAISGIECDHPCDNGNSWEPDENYCSHDIDTGDLSSVAEEMSGYTQEALTDLKNTLAFIKTFGHDEFDTIYSEREWRSISSFNFKWSDVSALILPEKNGYYQNFISKFKNKLQLLNKISIHRWEEINNKWKKD